MTPPAFSGMDQFVRADLFVPMMMSPRLISDPNAASLETRDARKLRVKGAAEAGRLAGLAGLLLVAAFPTGSDERDTNGITVIREERISAGDMSC